MLIDIVSRLDIRELVVHGTGILVVGHLLFVLPQSFCAALESLRLAFPHLHCLLQFLHMSLPWLIYDLGMKALSVEPDLDQVLLELPAVVTVLLGRR